MIELRHLRHMIALGEHANFRRAAAEVHLSQPALTKSIQQAERAYGAKLFDRQRRAVVPTAVGQVVLDRARSILTQVGEIQAAVTQLNGETVGEVVVGAGPLWAEALLAKALGRATARHPGLTFLVRAVSYHECVWELKSGVIELAVADPTEFASVPGLKIICLPTQPIVWFARPEHPLAGRPRVRRSELAKYPIVAPELPAWGRQWLGATQAEAKRPGKLPRVECESYGLLKKVVQSSDAVSAATRCGVADDLARGQFVELRVSGPKMTTQAGIIHRGDGTLSPAARLLVEQVEEVARSLET